MKNDKITTENLYALFTLCDQKFTTDTRKIIEGGIFFALKGANFDGNTFAETALEKGAAYCIVDNLQESNDTRILCTDNVLMAMQQLASYHRLKMDIPVVAITGSNGKTTTKELINCVLSKKFRTLATQGNLNNHIGVPITLLQLNKSHEVAIIEMGANHQREIAALCNIALPTHGLITNVGKAHLDGFGGFEGVIKGKTEMYEHLKQHAQTIFCNAGNQYLYPLVKTYPHTITYLGPLSAVTADYIDEGLFLGVNWRADGDSTHYHIRTQLTGAYNFENIVAAISIGHYFGVDAHHINSAIEEYIPDNQRSQIILREGNIRIILDAYNANPTSMREAILNFDKKFRENKMVILGDMHELGPDEDKEHQIIAELLLELGITETILVGPRFGRQQNISQAKHFETIDEAITYLNTCHLANHNILIKGSRSAAMEKVLPALHP